MLTSFYTAGMGTVSMQKGLDVLANNLANVNTAGFKKQNAAFNDLLYSNMLHQADGDKNVYQNLKVGHGVKLQKTDIVFEQGGMQSTGVDLDFAIQGEGFFELEGADGKRYYTRSGNFGKGISEDGDCYMISSDGSYVLDKNGDRIMLDDGVIPELSALDFGIYRFKNEYALDLVGSTNFSPNEWSGEAESVETPDIVQKYLEGSNVAVSDEMTKVIQTQRAFQFNTRMLQVADELHDTINRLW